jgi:putative nucleotidyltransferase with HDIG domain
MSETKGPPVSLVQDEDMVPVSREEFMSGSVVPCDVFVQLAPGKYLLLARSGGRAIFKEMHIADRKDVSDFHLRKEDYKNCVGQNLTVAGIIMDKKEMANELKTDILSRAADSVFKEIQILGFKSEAMKHSQSIAQQIQKLVSSKDDLSAIIDLMSHVSSDLVRHSMAVSAVSVMIAKGLGWVFPQTLQRLALGGLLHDVGLKELPKDLVSKPRHLMSREEVALYETHVPRGVNILKSMPSVPSVIISIIGEHHENAVGEGYPRKLREFNLNPLGKVVSLADEFVNLTIKNANNQNPKSAEEALFFIENTLGQPFSKMAFNGLMKALNDPAKSKSEVSEGIKKAA